jgi:hypothetical protein
LYDGGVCEENAAGPVGDNSCLSAESCTDAAGRVEDGSCHGSASVRAGECATIVAKVILHAKGRLGGHQWLQSF